LEGNAAMEKPSTTLCMLMSVDGKISTGSIDERDVDKDFPKIDGIKDGLHLYYGNAINFLDLFKQLKRRFNIETMTLQTGGTLNSIMLRNKLIDKISIVVAPALIGGKSTPALIDGESIKSLDELTEIKALKLPMRLLANSQNL
jgi:riboflavin biosynthesis pyrimidine reductase